VQEDYRQTLTGSLGWLSDDGNSEVIPPGFQFNMPGLSGYRKGWYWVPAITGSPGSVASMPLRGCEELLEQFF
jgi:hypothetical protein